MTLSLRLIFMLLLGLLLLILLLLLETLQSRLLVGTLLLLILRSVLPKGIQLYRKTALAASLLCLAGVVIVFPPRTSSTGDRIQSIFVNAQGEQVAQPWPVYLLNIFPEADLAKLSLLAADVFPFPATDVILDELRKQKADENNVFLREYRDLYQQRIGQVLPLQWLKGLGYYADISHYYLLRPISKNDSPAPVVVFLHGYMGNFQFYPGYFSTLDNCTVICPSSQNLQGRWDSDDLRRVLNIYMKQVADQQLINRKIIHLMGLSNGGSGLNAALHALPGRFSSFTFISTYLDDVPAQLTQPFYFIYGGKDSFAPNNVEMTARLRKAGFQVHVHRYEQERHFVMLNKREEIQQVLRRIVD